MLDQQRKYISETTSKDEQLKKALEEISALNKKLAEERTESEEKVRSCGESISLHFVIKLLIPLPDLVFSQSNIVNFLICIVLLTYLLSNESTL